MITTPDEEVATCMLFTATNVVRMKLGECNDVQTFWMAKNALKTSIKMQPIVHLIYLMGFCTLKRVNYKMGRCHMKTTHDTSEKNKSLNSHVIIMCYWPIYVSILFLKTLGIYVEQDLSYMSSYPWRGVPKPPRHQYRSLNFVNVARINVSGCLTSHGQKIKSILLQEEICSRIMGWSIKGYSVSKHSVWLSFNHLPTMVKVNILFAV